MRRKMILTFLLAAGCLFISSNAFSAWTEAKGHSYNQLTLSHYKTTSKMTSVDKLSFDEAKDRGDERDEGNVERTNAPVFKNEEEEFNQTQISYYGQYGVKDNLTAIISGGWAYVRSNDILANTGETDSVSGVGDISVGLMQKISDNVGGGPMSVQLDVKIPEAYDYENPLEFQNLGDGQYDYTLKLKFGHGFSKGYAVVDLGYKYRDYNKQLDDNLYFKPSDQFLVSLSGGYSAASWLSIRGTVGWNRAVGNARVSDDLALKAGDFGVKKEHREAVVILDTLGLEQSALSAGLSLAFTIKPQIQTVVSYNTDLAGFGELKTENASLGETYSIAFVYTH